MKTSRLIILIGILMVTVSLAAAAETPRSASVSEVSGMVEVQSGQGVWVPATTGMILNEGDSVRAKSGSWAVLNVDGVGQTATVEVKENSELKLATLLKNDEDATQTTLLDLSLGEILIKAKKLHSEKSKFEVKTPTSIVGVRGTTFSVSVEAVEPTE